jgi:hypothetical protein
MLLVYPIVASAQFVSQWTAKSCQGPPDMVFSYDSDFDVSKERYQLLSIVEEQYEIGDCGFQSRNLTNDCCQESLDETLKYKSLARVNNLKGMPVAANQVKYCHISNHGNATNDLYLREGSECMEGFICSEAGLEVFLNDNCTGVAEPLSLNRTHRVIRSKFRGAFNASQFLFSEGRVSYAWISMVPTRLLVPDFKHAGDYVGLVALSLAMLIQIAVIVYSLQMAIRIGRKTEYAELYCAILWLVALCLAAVYYYVSFPSTEAVSIFAGIAWPVINIGTLVPVLLTITFIYTVSPPKNEASRLFSYIAVLLLHVGFGGAYYLQYWYESENLNLYDQWKQFYPIWIIISFGVIFIPIYMGIERLGNGAKLSMGKLINLISKDGHLSSIFLLYILTLVSYVIVYLHLTVMDVVLGDDLMYFGFLQIPLLCYTLLYLCKLLMKRRISELYFKQILKE